MTPASPSSRWAPTGCLLIEGGQRRSFPAETVTAVDTTGCGDAFCGVMAAALARGFTTDEAIGVAQKAAALTATRPGAFQALPSRRGAWRASDRPAARRNSRPARESNRQAGRLPYGSNHPEAASSGSRRPALARGTRHRAPARDHRAAGAPRRGCERRKDAPQAIGKPSRPAHRRPQPDVQATGRPILKSLRPTRSKQQRRPHPEERPSGASRRMGTGTCVADPSRRPLRGLLRVRTCCLDEVTPARLDREPLDFARGRLHPERRDLLSTISGLLWRRSPCFALGRDTDSPNAIAPRKTEWQVFFGSNLDERQVLEPALGLDVLLDLGRQRPRRGVVIDPDHHRIVDRLGVDPGRDLVLLGGIE